MATRVIDDTKLQNIAVAIQAKDNGGQMTVDEMAGRIEAMPTGSDFDMTVTDNQVKMIIDVFDFDLSFWTRFGIDGDGTVTVDWGDGTVDEFTSEEVLLEYAPQRKHSYQKAGKYLVVLTISDRILSIGSINNYCTLSEGELSGNNINQNDEIRRVYNYKLKEISIGDHVTVWGGLRNVPFLKIHTDINYWLFGTSTDYIKIKNGFTVFDEYSFAGVYAYKIKIPSSVTTFSSYSFANSKIRIIDFTDISLNENNELPITFVDANVFRNISSNTILLFATQEIAEVAKTTTNLSQLASQIKYVGEV